MSVLQMRKLRQEAIMSRSHGHDGCGGIAGLRSYSMSPMLFWNPHPDLIRGGDWYADSLAKTPAACSIWRSPCFLPAPGGKEGAQLVPSTISTLPLG